MKPEHPYAADLDLFGKGSLFELISTARTHVGEDTLARWLLAPAAPEEIRARQNAIDELRPRLDLREDLAIFGEEARTGVDPVSLAAWGEAPSEMQTPGLRAILWLLTAFGIVGAAALFVWLCAIGGLLHLRPGFDSLTRDLALIVLLVNGLFLHRHRQSTERVVAAVDEAAHGLGLLSEVLVRLERERFQTPMLAKLRQSLDADGEPPSDRISRLNKLVERLDSRDHVFVRILEPFVLWTMHTALGVENWRRHYGLTVRRWLVAMGEIEALARSRATRSIIPEIRFRN